MMRFPFEVDERRLADCLGETRVRLLEIRNALDEATSVRIADWLEVFDALDTVKERGEESLRPAPRGLVVEYVRVRTWLREIYPRLQRHAQDSLGRLELDMLLKSLERELSRRRGV